MKRHYAFENPLITHEQVIEIAKDNLAINRKIMSLYKNQHAVGLNHRFKLGGFSYWLPIRKFEEYYNIDSGLARMAIAIQNRLRDDEFLAFEKEFFEAVTPEIDTSQVCTIMARKILDKVQTVIPYRMPFDLLKAYVHLDMLDELPEGSMDDISNIIAYNNDCHNELKYTVENSILDSAVNDLLIRTDNVNVLEDIMPMSSNRIDSLIYHSIKAAKLADIERGEEIKIFSSSELKKMFFDSIKSARSLPQSS